MTDINLPPLPDGMALVPTDPDPSTLRKILVDMAYDLFLVPDGDEVPVQLLDVLRRQYFAAIEAGKTNARAAVLADRQQPKESALEAYKLFGGDEETTPIERLRAFCSFAMSEQDWLDVEPFFDAVLADQQRGEPIAWMHTYRKPGSAYQLADVGEHGPDPEPGYTHFAREPLYARPVDKSPDLQGSQGDKSTETQRGEPVAWMDCNNPQELVIGSSLEGIDPMWRGWYRPLYARPPIDPAEVMRLADEYAEMVADVRAKHGYPEHAIEYDRKLMNEARAALAAYLEGKC